MDSQTLAPARRPRFRRASEPPAFRLTEDDVEIIRQVARHRFLRSTHIAALVGRSLDRTNDRLSNLFHAGYLDRPRAQLDYYPTSGSAPFVYALADRGARLLAERDGAPSNFEWSRKNHESGRPFLKHQLEIMDFYIGLTCTMRARTDLRLIHPEELLANFPAPPLVRRAPFMMRANDSASARARAISVVPDLAFGLELPDRSRRHFLVEIDRGTMPVRRSDIFKQTSFEEKMRAYLAAHTARQHERQFAWKNFRILTVTTDERRMRTMMEALRALRFPQGPGASLFYFATRDGLGAGGLLSDTWKDGNNRNIGLI